eukprot:3064213-Pyramimonas_sp.AAC.1
MSAHRSHASCPDNEHHPKPQCHRPHASPTLMSARPSHVSWPQMGPPLKAAMPPPACATHTHFGTPLTRFVAPERAPPKAPAPPPA